MSDTSLGMGLLATRLVRDEVTSAAPLAPVRPHVPRPARDPVHRFRAVTAAVLARAAAHVEPA